MSFTRSESDSFGPIQIPGDALWGAQTERSRHFFAVGGITAADFDTWVVPRRMLGPDSF